MVVYKLTNIINGMAYIGATSKKLKDRWGDHINRANTSMFISREINRVGKSHFKIEIIDGPYSKKDAFKKERYWILKLNTIYPNGYNMPFFVPNTSVPIICTTTKGEYSSATEASKALKLDTSSITKCCKGKLKQVKGYHFIYADKKLRPMIDKKWLNRKTSKYKGVSLCRRTGKWVASIHPNKRSIHLGRFKEEKDAHEAYLKAREKYYGQ